MKEAPRLMAKNQNTPTPEREGASVPGARRWRVGMRLAVVLPLLALLTVLTATGVAFAGGATPGVTVSPASGPVGTNVTLSGNGFHVGDNILVGYSTGNCSSSVITIAKASGAVGGDGKFTIPFVWPSTQIGSYTLCAIDQTNNTSYPSATKFQVLSPNPPTITVNGPVTSGQPVQVTGANFLPGGGTAEVRYGSAGSNGCANDGATVTVNSDGSFTATFTAPYTAADTTIVVSAVEPQGSCGGSPVLQAQTNVSVKAAAVPIVTVTATTTPVVSPPAPPSQALPWPPTWPPSGAWTVVYCLIGLLLLLLLLLLIFLLVRRRRKDEPVTIEERDSVVINSSAASSAAGTAGMGRMTLQRDIIARDAKGRETPIAEEIYSTEEEIVDDNQPQPPHYGPPTNS